MRIGIRLLLTTSEVDIEEWLEARMEMDDLPSFNEYGDFKLDAQGFYRGGNISTSVNVID